MRLHMIESDDKQKFLAQVNGFLEGVGRSLFSVKFQRNLYYSLSGSTGSPSEAAPEGKKMLEGFVAFIVFDDTMYDASVLRGALARCEEQI